MQPLQADQIRPKSQNFFSAGPGAMVGRHILNTGCGSFYADRYPEPRLVFSRSGGNLALAGDPAAGSPQRLREIVTGGMLDASLDFEPLLRETFSRVQIWKRLVYNLEQAPVISRSGGFFLRRLSAADLPALENLSPPNRWIWNTWQDAATLSASGFAWGAFRGDRLASLACSFFVGDEYEDIGVVTEQAFRAQGLSSACTAQLCLDIQARGRTPCWTTSTTNRASQRVAEKTGFTIARPDFLFVINTEIPD